MATSTIENSRRNALKTACGASATATLRKPVSLETFSAREFASAHPWRQFQSLSAINKTMQPNFLGRISTPSAGTPVPLITDRTVRACKILFVTIPGFIGNICVGGANMDTATLEGVLIKFNRPAMAGQPDHFAIDAPHGANALIVSDYWIAASAAGGGVLVTYFQS